MYDKFIEIIPDLALGALAILGMIFLVVFLTRGHRQSLQAEREERLKMSKAFVDFAISHNHEFANLSRETALAIQKTGQAIETNTEQNKMLTEAIINSLKK